jgi:serine/threonine protein kinase
VAPEVIKLEKATYASDIWSLACTVVELLTGKPPYANMLAMTAMFKIVEDDMPPLPKGCSPELQDFLGLCFAKDPRHRPSAEALFEHIWLRKHWSNHTVCPRVSLLT